MIEKNKQKILSILLSCLISFSFDGIYRIIGMIKRKYPVYPVHPVRYLF